MIYNISNNINNTICDNENNIIIKKRGRKPKIIIEKEPIIKIPKKRGRKPTGKILIIDKKSEIMDIKINDCFLAHLKLDNKIIQKIIDKKKITNENSQYINNDDELKKNIIKINFSDNIINNNENIKLINEIKCLKCSDLENKISCLENKLSTLNITSEISETYKKKIIESKVNFYDKDKNSWIDKTDISCWWCCHNFTSIPLGLPNNYNKDKFYVFGCFCSLNCAYAYNLDLNDYRVWDRQSLIYHLKSIIQPDDNNLLKPAPPRQILQKFGGHISITQYRENFFTIDKDFLFILPPLISVIGIIEESNKSSIKTFKKSSEEYILKRTKPLPVLNHKFNTLFSKE